MQSQQDLSIAQTNSLSGELSLETEVRGERLVREGMDEFLFLFSSVSSGILLLAVVWQAFALRRLRRDVSRLTSGPVR